MADLPNPAGTLASFSFLGKTTVAAGAISTTLTVPINRDFFFVSLWATWPHGGYEAARTANSITISWTMPAPVGGGQLRWLITV